MNWDRIQRSRKRVMARVKAKGGKVPDRDFEPVPGWRDEPAGRQPRRLAMVEPDSEELTGRWESPADSA